MALSLKTFKGGNVTPQDDAIIHQTILPGAGVFKGCEVAVARSNVLHISQGFGMIAGRFFEMYETEVPVQLEATEGTKQGRLYLHMDLSNTDEPLQVLTEVSDELSSLSTDNNVNYNNTTYDMELAIFKVTSTEVSDLKNTFTAIQPIGGGDGAAGIMRETNYQVGDTTSNPSAPGWCTLYCVQAGKTAKTEPDSYAQIARVGDQVLDGTAMFEARNTIAELTQAEQDITALGGRIDETVAYVNAQLSDTGNLTQKVMSTADYNRLSKKDPNTIYYCYDDTTTKEIKHIYLGQKVMVDTTVSVTYNIDTGNAVTKTVSTQTDALLVAPAATKQGYTLLGWKLNNTADGDVLPEYIISGTAAVTLYAVFSKAVTVVCDPMDADIPDGEDEPSIDTTMYYNNGNKATDEIEMPNCPYTMEDKSFYAWTCDPNSDGEYIPLEKYRIAGDTLYPVYIETEKEFPYVANNSYSRFVIQASGLYEFQLWGGAGGDAEYTPSGGTKLVAKGGKGGYVKVFRRLKKGDNIYVMVGAKPNGTNSPTNCGGYGRSYNSNTGATGGGATAVCIDNCYNPNDACHNSNYGYNYYSNREKFIAVAGGGGAGGIAGNTADGVHDGGYAGGEKGQNGSGGALGGAQITNGNNEYDGFGGVYVNTSSSYTYSGGGAGWFGGQTAQNGASGAGGSSYVRNSATFTFRGVRYKTVNQADNNDGNGHVHMKFMLPCFVE